MSLDVALVTCVRLPEPDPDAEPLGKALAEAGLVAGSLAWDDPAVDWSEARLTVLRSCWNYPRHLPEFLAWARTAASVSRLWNPLEVVRWGSHKKYLLDLEVQGVPITPTVLLPRGDSTTLAEIRERRGWEETVIKPAVSAASFRTLRVGPEQGEAGERHLRGLLVERDVLVQPYLRSVDGHGERAVMWIDGALTHAVRKAARFEDDAESVSPQAVPIEPAEAELAERALAAAPRPLLYARIDMARDAADRPVLMELEVLEPSLFFDQSAPALSRFVAAIEDRL